MPPSIPRPALSGKRPQILTQSRLSYRSPNHIYIRRISDTTPRQNAQPRYLTFFDSLRGVLRGSRPNNRPKEPKKVSDPLCILFCGSDDFSCASLTALHSLHQSRPDLIDSIDVLVRPGKPAGRGLKRINVGPLYHLADSLDLPIHQRDTFTGWTLPLPGRVTHPKTGKRTIHPHPTSPLPSRPFTQFNLLIAVSFGLFVPPRILNALKYGGLNIHPSLLPDLKGPAPIPRAILANHPFTGVTLQTLHPRHFDGGAILAQTPRIPIAPDATTPSLLAALAPVGAELLVKGLQEGLHVLPPDEPPPPPTPTPTPFGTSGKPLGPRVSAVQPDVLYTGRGPRLDLPPFGAAGFSPPSPPPSPPPKKEALPPKGVYRKHVLQVRPPPDLDAAQHLCEAPKITPADRVIDWGGYYWAAAKKGAAPHDDNEKKKAAPPPSTLLWTAADLARRYRAVGTSRGLWTFALSAPPEIPSESRLIFEDVEAVRCPAVLRNVVRAIVAIKTAAAAAGDGGEERQKIVLAREEAKRREDVLRSPVPGEDGSEVGGVVFAMQTDWAVPQRLFRLPVCVVDGEGGEDSGSVVIPVRVPYRTVDGEVELVEGGECDAIRVKRIKSEGKASRDARLALKPFLERHWLARDFVTNEFAMHVMAREVD